MKPRVEVEGEQEESKEEEAKQLEEWENYLKAGGDEDKPLDLEPRYDKLTTTYVFSESMDHVKARAV